MSKFILAYFLLFIALYNIATLNYPGGSLTSPTASHFLWTENYFCDMMNSVSINGKENPSKPYSIGALLSLCAGITSFFIWFSNERISQYNFKRTLKLLGSFSMLSTCLIFTPWHNQFIISALIFGLIPCIIILNVILRNINAYHTGLTIFVFTFLTGYIIIYYLNIFPISHPIVQKCAILFGLLWIIKTKFKGEDN